MLIGAKLRKADFTSANLQGAFLVDSDLRGAKFECIGIRVFEQTLGQQCASLQGATLVDARLQGARPNFAQLQGASLAGASLQGATPQSPQVPELAKTFLDEEHCPGAHELTDAEKTTLKAIRDRNPPPAPKQ